VSSQVQGLDLEIQAFLDQAYKHNQGVGTCEIGIGVEKHWVALREIGILARMAELAVAETRG
jgi:hypothetical protein